MGVKVRQKTKGKGNPWWIFVSHQGKRTSKLVGDKAATEAVASKIRAKLQLGEFSFEDEKPVPTFKEYADSWIKITVPATCKKSTLSDYQDILKKSHLTCFWQPHHNRYQPGNDKRLLVVQVKRIRQQ